MHIQTVTIKNFKCFEDFEITFKKGLNIIVGDNDAGKSTILEAIHLALTGIHYGRFVRNEISPYLFNKGAEQAYLQSFTKGSKAQPPPEISIEIYFSYDVQDFHELKGNGNGRREDACGVRCRIYFDEDNFRDAYQALVKTGKILSIPVEYYRMEVLSFARIPIISRNMPVKSALIDSSSSKFQNGSDQYISRIIRDFLTEDEKIKIFQAHRELRSAFAENNDVSAINKKIKSAAKVTEKTVEVSVDLSSQNAWESSLTTYVDAIPFQHIGKGEQCLIKTHLALNAKNSLDAHLLLIEEPESHLTYARLNQFLDQISRSDEKQIITTTHSSLVANKLGLENLILLKNHRIQRLNDLPCYQFFKKAPGFDTLRLVLAQRVVLVEGPSDELIFQRAFMDANNGSEPIQKGIDVISVGTAFLRFLEIAERLQIPTNVITDNDGDPDRIKRKFAPHSGKKFIKVFYEEEVASGNLSVGENKFNYNTLEPSILRANSLATLNQIFGEIFLNEDDLHLYMNKNKTDCALKILESPHRINFPEYFQKAISACIQKT